MQHSRWEKVEAFSRDIAIAMVQAKSSRDYQPIGVRCREALIALADAVHDPARHPPVPRQNLIRLAQEHRDPSIRRQAHDSEPSWR